MAIAAVKEKEQAFAKFARRMYSIIDFWKLIEVEAEEGSADQLKAKGYAETHNEIVALLTHFGMSPQEAFGSEESLSDE
jgi:pyruvate formate-lyase activating enzyme-like uncharacterized protein